MLRETTASFAEPGLHDERHDKRDGLTVIVECTFSPPAVRCAPLMLQLSPAC